MLKLQRTSGDGPETLGGRNQAAASWTVASSEWLHSFRPKMVVAFSFMKFWSTVCRISAKGAGRMQNRDSDLSCIKPSSGVKTDAG